MFTLKVLALLLLSSSNVSGVSSGSHHIARNHCSRPIFDARAVVHHSEWLRSKKRIAKAAQALEKELLKLGDRLSDAEVDAGLRVKDDYSLHVGGIHEDIRNGRYQRAYTNGQRVLNEMIADYAKVVHCEH